MRYPTLRWRRAARPARPAHRPPRLRAERLEDRCVPATLLVTTNAPAGPGSLPAAVSQAAAGDVITFSPTLAGQPIFLASTLTIDKGITILGSSPSDVIIGGTFINGGGGGRVLNVTSS